MIKFLDILKESDDNIFIPRGSKEEKDKVLLRRTNDKIQEYIKNGFEGNLDLRNLPIKFLPKNLTRVGGYLWLDFCENLQSLPNGLKVDGDLDLRFTNITFLPSDIQVKGDLDLRNSSIKSLPSDIEVGRNLILINSQIEKLPDNLTVNGYLWLDYCKNLQELPNGLKVKNDLDLRNTNITSLPSDLEVGGNLILYRTPIADMYTKEQIRKMIPRVKGNLMLY
jgi:hypothetical protein